MRQEKMQRMGMWLGGGESPPAQCNTIVRPEETAFYPWCLTHGCVRVPIGPGCGLESGARGAASSAGLA